MTRKRRPAVWKHRLEDAALTLISGINRPLGWRGSQKFGSLLGTLWYYGYRRRVDVSRENILRAFPGMSDKDAARIASASFRSIAATFMEFARFPYMNAADAARRARVTTPELLERLRDEGKGGILVTGHYGNWELFGGAVAGLGFPMSFVVGRQTNRYVDARINEYRRCMGVSVIERGAALRAVPRALARNEFVAVLSDQDAGKSGVFVDFLGTPASTPRGAGFYSHKTGSPVLPGRIVRLPDGSHEGTFTEPIYPDAGAESGDDIQRITQAFTRELEHAVRLNPNHYFWPHRRWKTKPPAETREGMQK